MVAAEEGGRQRGWQQTAADSGRQRRTAADIGNQWQTAVDSGRRQRKDII